MKGFDPAVNSVETGEEIIRVLEKGYAYVGDMYGYIYVACKS